MTTNHNRRRHLQREARVWAEFAGINYTAALRHLENPLLQGILGERITVTRLIETLGEHPTLGIWGLAVTDSVPYPSQLQKGTLARVVLSAEVLRMFAIAAVPEVSSYTLKHIAEKFLPPVESYISNGELIWAAAALGLPMDYNGDGPNASIAVSRPELDYARRALGKGYTQPGSRHYQPWGWDHLRGAIDGYAANNQIPARVAAAPDTRQTSPFHHWLVVQARRDDMVGDLANDYREGVESSDHDPVDDPEHLRQLIEDLGGFEPALDAVELARAEWVLQKDQS